MKIIVEFKILDGDKESEERLKNHIYRIKGVSSTILKSYNSNDETLDYIESLVCDFTKTTPKQIKESKRNPAIAVEARQICQYLGRKLELGSLVYIGQRFGNKDHATVLNSYNRISGFLESDKVFKNNYADFIESIIKTVGK